MPAATSQITSEDPNSPPKGILKPPRYRFLEEPYPFRQGLPSSSNTENISPDGRYTNLDRRLVNPEALKRGGERSEERSGYVRVSRYLSKEEIQAYAIRTHKLRDARYAQYCEIRRSRETSSTDSEESLEI